MTEPENHTLHLLREIRDDVQTLGGDIKRLERKVDRGFADVKLAIDGLAQSLAGEIATRGYALGGIERRLNDLENRLSALEHADNDT